MTAFASVVLAVAVADLRHGLTGEPAHRRAVVEATILGVAVALGAAALTGQPDRATAAIVVVAAAVVAGWSELRARRAPAAWPLAALGVGLAVALALDSRITSATGGAWEWIWGDLRIPAAERVDDGRAAVVIALGVALTATANSVVRLVLALDEVRVDEGPGTTVRGGRVIGPIERLVIFGAVVAGAPTVAGFVVAAKSLLRFPELTDRSRVDEATEYVVIGSLASWGLALAAAALAG